jgi:hypothetical protein
MHDPVIEDMLSGLGPATPEQIRSQREGIARYKPGPRQCHPHAPYALEVLEMVQSLQDAIRDAGGGIEVSPKWMRATTVETMILMLASNGIRFHREKT